MQHGPLTYILVLAKYLIASAVFVLIFSAVDGSHFFEKSVVLLIFAVFISNRKSSEIDRVLYASAFMLEHLAKKDDGSDVLLTAATRSLAECIGGTEVKEQCASTPPKFVWAEAHARASGSIIEWLLFIAMSGLFMYENAEVVFAFAR